MKVLGVIKSGWLGLLLAGAALVWPGPVALAVERGTGAKPVVNQKQVDLAMREAMANLMDDVGRTPLAQGVTVREFLRVAGGGEEVMKLIQTAEQVGGARWIDDRTCQVELQISGARVAHQIEMIARARPKDLPFPIAEIEKPLAQMRARSFSATGAAVNRAGLTSPAPVQGAAPATSQATGAPAKPQVIRSTRWARVSDTVCELVVMKAKLDAAQTSLRSVSPLMLTSQSTVGDALSVNEVGPAMEQWFVTQPMTRLEYRDDLQAEVTLEVPPLSAFDRFRALSQKQTQVAVPSTTDDGLWGKVKDGFKEKMAAPVGRAAVDEDPLGFAPRRAMGLDRGKRGVPGARAEAPAWVAKRLEADGIGTARRGRLMAARAAETGAEAKLRLQIEALEWKPGRTIGEAAKENKRVDAAVTRALHAARIGKTEYREDGSAKVDLYLDLENLWAELKDVE